MYKIAERFSLKAREVAAAQEYRHTEFGPVATYKGADRCPLAIMLIVDKHTGLNSPNSLPLLTPSGEEVASMLNDLHDPQWDIDRRAATEFINATEDRQWAGVAVALGVETGG